MNKQDNTTFTPEEIQKRFDALPKDLQSLIESEGLVHTLTRLGNQHVFSEDDINTLQDIVGLVILGLIPRTNLKEELDVFGIPEEEMMELKKELDALVFDPFNIGTSSSLRGNEEINIDVLNFGLDASQKQSIEKETLDRDALLAEIEDKEDAPETEDASTSQSSEEQDFVSKKMAGGGGLPRTESRFDDEDSGKSEKKPSEQDSGYDVDPYREPIE